MQNKYNRLRKLLFQLGSIFGISLLSIQIYQTYKEIRSNDLIIHLYWPLFLAIFLIILSIFQQVEAWIILMRSLKIRIPSYEARFGYVISFLARYIPGTVWGYINRSEWLWQKYNISYKKSNYGSFLEVILAILGGLWAIGFCSINYSSSLRSNWIYFLLITFPILSWVFIASGNKLLRKRNNNESEKTNVHIPSFSNWLFILLLLFVNWFYYGLGLFLIGYSLNVWEFNQLVSLLTHLTRDFALAWLMGFIVIFIPSGLGVRELVLSSQLANNFQLSLGTANNISIMMRLITTTSEIAAIVLFYFLYTSQTNLLRKDHSS